MRRATLARLFALALSLMPVGQVQAQGRQPVVLQHGFLSHAGTWDDLAPWLEANLYVTTHRWTTGWNSPYEKQATRLIDFMSLLPDTTILIGHSNGGILSRRLSTMRRTKGYITVGTPHGGAPLAASLMNGGVAMFAGSLENAGAQAYGVYGRPEYDSYDDSFRYQALWAAQMEAGLGRVVGWVAEGMNYLDDIGQTVLTDMQPGSVFFGNLNHPTMTALELQLSSGPRVAFASSVVTNWFPEYMMWKGVYPTQSAYLSNLTDAAIYTLLMAYDHYSWYWAPWDEYSFEKQAYAVIWLWAAGTLSGIDLSWCHLIGAWNGSGCEPADGIVPASLQRNPTPGAVNRNIYGPAHQEEINSRDFWIGVHDELRNRFLVKPPATAVRASTP